jgi:hypothetical protein
VSSFRCNIGESFFGVDFSGTFNLILEPPVIKAISWAVSSFDVTWETSSITTETTVDGVQTFVTFQVFANLINGIIYQICFAFLSVFKIILVIMDFNSFD